MKFSLTFLITNHRLRKTRHGSNRRNVEDRVKGVKKNGRIRIVVETKGLKGTRSLIPRLKLGWDNLLIIVIVFRSTKFLTISDSMDLDTKARDTSIAKF